MCTRRTQRSWVSWTVNPTDYIMAYPPSTLGAPLPCTPGDTLMHSTPALHPSCTAPRPWTAPLMQHCTPALDCTPALHPHGLHPWAAPSWTDRLATPSWTAPCPGLHPSRTAPLGGTLMDCRQATVQSFGCHSGTKNHSCPPKLRAGDVAPTCCCRCPCNSCRWCRGRAPPPVGT